MADRRPEGRKIEKEDERETTRKTQRMTEKEKERERKRRKCRKKDVKKISGSLTQQVVFNRNDDPEYAEKMEKVRREVYKQLGRKDLLDKMDESLEEPLYNSFFILENVE